MVAWWIELGFPAFEAGYDGFPRPGQVLKHYRVLKLKENGKPWMQSDLAEVLNVSVQAVRDMENRDRGFSIEKRRFLANLFHIPSILLGIVTLEDILQQYPEIRVNASSGSESSSASSEKKPVIDVQAQRKALLSYWEANHVDTVHKALNDVLRQIEAVDQTLPYIEERQKPLIIALLCDYRQFAANVFRDQARYADAIEHLNRALSLAKSLDDRERLALVFQRRAITLQEQGNLPAALQDIEAARSLAPHLSQTLQATILLEAGHVQARLARTETEKTAALRTIEDGGRIIRSGPFAEDPHFLRLDHERYHLTRGSALLAMNRNKDALDELDMVECEGKKRRKAYMTILSAQAYANRGMYPIAIDLAADALPVVKEIRSSVNVARIEAIYRQVLRSSYGDTPVTARLGYLLQVKYSG